MYKFYNANSRGKYVNDCVIRAISLAENKSWNETYDKLSDLAQFEGTLLDDTNFVEDYLDDRYYRIPHKSKYVGELCYEFPYGTYLVTMPNHISILKNGMIIDTFDCRDRRVFSIWEVS